MVSRNAKAKSSAWCVLEVLFLVSWSTFTALLSTWKEGAQRCSSFVSLFDFRTSTDDL